MRITRQPTKRMRDIIREHNLKKDGIGGSGSLGYLELNKGIDGGFIVEQDNTCVGWGVAWNNKEFHLYILPAYRRQKIGSRLVERAMKHFPDHTYCPWDSRSREFFNKLKAPTHWSWV